MNQEEKRIKIAEACGWREAFPPNRKPHKLTKRGGILLPYYWIQDGTGKRARELPDYFNDLNAMHEAEKALNEKQAVWYLQKLSQERLRQGESGMIACMIDRLAFATASQRAEAFGKTLNLW